MSSVVPDLNYADIKEVECALPGQPRLSCRYQIRIGGKVRDGTGRDGLNRKTGECFEPWFIPLPSPLPPSFRG